MTGELRGISAAFTLAFLCVLLFAHAADAAELRGIAVKIFDGDSFVMRDAQSHETEVRLFGIDAPEHAQPHAEQSRDALKALIEREPLIIEIRSIDRYGRTLGVVLRQRDQLRVNERLLHEGHAWLYRRYQDDPQWVQLELEARHEHAGLWSLPGKDRIAPWVYRKELREFCAQRTHADESRCMARPHQPPPD
jgi:micrococcal nuclease